MSDVLDSDVGGEVCTVPCQVDQTGDKAQGEEGARFASFGGK